MNEMNKNLMKNEQDEQKLIEMNCMNENLTCNKLQLLKIDEK